MTGEPIDLAALIRAGETLGRTLAPGSVVWLQGPLGAGKTTLARALVRGRGGGDRATSPTFSLVHHYQGAQGPIYHVDCYRLRRVDDAADLDWHTLMSGDLLLIEWPERAGAWAAPATVQVTLDLVDDTRRRLTVR